MRRTRLSLHSVRASALLLLSVVAPAGAQTIVPLNTGYNHAVFTPYGPAGIPSVIKDNYWINIASYPPTAPPVAPSWVLPVSPSWVPAFPNTRWIGARNTTSSPPGTSVQNPAYSIFRKCFCLLPNFKNASLKFQVRADDQIQVWFNTVLNVALPPTVGNWSGSPLSSKPSAPNWFRVGMNCIYVLVEDTGGHMGFDMAGTIQADGLSPLPAFGVDRTFDCPCRDSAQVVQGSGARAQDVRARVADEDQRIVSEIIRIAQERRLRRTQTPRLQRR
ncbi:MAG TPA: hypothetical protein VF263_12505 [Longimicrobiaceae bacterium]